MTTEQRLPLLKEKARTGASVIGAAINAISFAEAQDYDAAFAILKAAVDAHQEACRAYCRSFEDSPAERKETRKHVHPAA